jgi:hypothetical protein
VVRQPARSWRPGNAPILARQQQRSDRFTISRHLIAIAR